VNADYVLAPAAQDDIDAEASYIADLLGEPAAGDFIDRMHDALGRLAANPGLGHRRSDLTALPVHFWTVLGRYAVVYRKRQPLEVVRVLGWKQDVPAILRRDDDAVPE